MHLDSRRVWGLLLGYACCHLQLLRCRLTRMNLPKEQSASLAPGAIIAYLAELGLPKSAARLRVGTRAAKNVKAVRSEVRLVQQNLSKCGTHDGFDSFKAFDADVGYPAVLAHHTY